ncbi:MAG: hypothetical protein WD766_06860 [Gemmatimonadota bacterium]
MNGRRAFIAAIKPSRFQLPLPSAHLLVGAGAAELARGRSDLPQKSTWIVGGIFGVLPDMDIAVGVALGVGTALHGTVTHALFAVLVVLFPSVPWQRGGGAEQAAVGLMDPEILPWFAAQTAVGLGFFALAMVLRRILLGRARPQAR